MASGRFTKTVIDAESDFGNFIAYNNDIDKEIDAIYDKLGGISKACTCKEDT